MQDVIRKEMKDHLKDIDYDSPRWKLHKDWHSARDLIDSYLIEMKTSGDPEFHGEQLTMVGMDLMSAGSDVRTQNPFPYFYFHAQTTSTTLLWTVIYLVLNPEVQERCYQEVSSWEFPIYEFHRSMNTLAQQQCPSQTCLNFSSVRPP